MKTCLDINERKIEALYFKALPGPETSRKKEEERIRVENRSTSGNDYWTEI